MKDILEEAQERYTSAVEAEATCRREQEEDIRFEAGDQWPEQVKRMRETDPDGPRPCLVINMARKHKQALLNDIRRSRPAIKVLPVDDKADVRTAEILNGVYRHIHTASDADVAYDTAADGQVTSGLGYFRVLTEVVDEAKNEQEIRIAPIKNPFSVYMDPFAEDPAGRDANWCFITQEVNRKTFKAQYPAHADAADWDGSDSALSEWYPTKDTIRVAEYFCVKDYQGKQRCHWYKLGGNVVIDERVLLTSHIPVIRVVGEERHYNDKRDFRGIIRDIRDPQRMYNYWSSANTEAIALAPKAPYLVPAEAVEGHEDAWADANTSNRPYLTYNQFESESGERLDQPKRAQPAQVNTGIVQSMLQAAEDMRQVSGQSQTSFGDKSNEQSGRAINARRAEQDNNTFHFVDNLGRAIKHAGRIILEMIPQVYDTRRVVRILGEDETPDFAILDPALPRSMVEQTNAAGGVERIYNPTIGRYDVRVVVGPSYATKQEEAAERLGQIIQSAPDLMAIAGDLLFKAMDIPGSDDLAERMKLMLPPQIAQMEAAKKSGQAEGMQQAEMVRQQMMEQIAPMVEELKAALDAAAAENDELQSAVDQLKQALDDKQVEYQIKAAEIEQDANEAQLKHAADMADAEAKVAVAYIGAQQQDKQPAQPSQTDAMANTSAAVAAQQAVQMMGDLAKQLTEQIQATVQAVSAVQSAQTALDEQSQQLAQKVAENESQRTRMSEIAAALLAGKMTEEQAAAAISGRLQ